MKLFVYLSEKQTPITNSVLLSELTGKRHSNIVRAIKRKIAAEGNKNFYGIGSKGHYSEVYVMTKQGCESLLQTMHDVDDVTTYIMEQFANADQEQQEEMENTMAEREPSLFDEDLQQETDMEHEPEVQPQKREQQEILFDLFKDIVTTSTAVLQKASEDYMQKVEGIFQTLADAFQKECRKMQLPREEYRSHVGPAITISEQNVSVQMLAKMLTAAGVPGMGEIRLFTWLRDNGFLGQYGDDYNLPTQERLEQGLFTIVNSQVELPTGKVLNKLTTKVTPKGQEYFINKFVYNQINQINGK